MRGVDRLEGYVTTDLLTVWTDPDTAMEAVGASLGIFGARVADVRRVLSTDSPLRRALYAVLLDLVAGGALEQRATSDGRYAFRWRADIASAVFDAPVDTHAIDAAARPDVDIDLTIEPEPEPETELEELVAPAAVVEPVAVIERVSAATPVALRGWERAVAALAPLLFPAISCVLAIAAFLWLDLVGGLIVAAALTVAGVVGLLRRVPFAGLWIMGVLVAGLLLRLS